MRSFWYLAFDDAVYFLQLVHQIGFIMQPSGSVNKKYVDIAGNSGFDSVKNHGSRVSAFFVTDNFAAGTLAPNLQLFGSGGTEGIAGKAAAKKNMHKVAMKGTTIPHEIVGKYGAGAVLLKPAAAGTGMIAGGPVRAVIEAAGIKDIRAKSMRSNNPINVVSATFAGLCGLVSAESVAEKRGKTVKEILG